MTLKLAKLAGASTFALALVTLPSAGAEEPLAIAKQGYFFVGGKYATSTSTAPLYPPLYRDICGARSGGVLANPGPWRDIKPFAPPIK